jgi:hypothetical protein
MINNNNNIIKLNIYKIFSLIINNKIICILLLLEKIAEKNIYMYIYI